MPAGVEVVDDDLDDLVLLEDEWMSVLAVHLVARGAVCWAQDGVQSRDLTGCVGYVVKKAMRGMSVMDVFSHAGVIIGHEITSSRHPSMRLFMMTFSVTV
jgi:hypothetical protein